ncbi:NAD(P)H-dependent flavin oxidoreductase [Massilia antarctica]|uniref:NAD(P)H-dependent flavin oxidoreductase n=1 Tax=Massilia antarctica TaxID=2765360 RepID=UPI0006BB5844|nr:nitronate monooxygenase [Massilia sp. H27-R4]MCY0912160.1 nitronate monooxygenase [Massilia sp. H27-R4]CUI06365.1 Enoyl-[acyl-carrier-protein] reductase [FMN] [Janthinobacterium sp. CG23_2]CUU30151.1 Enoyl-[acyl-carrier-protein] reductase [FMN] [Janthinobacterium sp. CG23_2]
MTLQGLFKFPILQGPMAGGASRAELVAAVSNAGGLGCMAGSLMSPAAMRDEVGRIRSMTDQPFLLNLFVLQTPSPSAEEVNAAVELLRPVWESLGWDKLPIPAQWCQDFEAQFATLIELRPAAASFTFGILTPSQVERLHDAGIVVIGTVTTVDEALAWENVGADAVVASGIESGGHRGTFLGPQEDATLGGKALWPQVATAVKIPMIAAGGIMTGVDIAEALALGAQAVQMGSAFIVTDESGIHPAYKQRLIEARDTPTRLTRAFSGRYARGLENTFMRKMESVEKQVPAYPVQNALTTGIRAAAAERGDTELMSLWAGAEIRRARPMPVAQLMQMLVAEMRTN